MIEYKTKDRIINSRSFDRNDEPYAIVSLYETLCVRTWKQQGFPEWNQPEMKKDSQLKSEKALGVFSRRLFS